MIKWIPAILTPLAKEAIERIRTITEPWRRVAKWYEEHPDQIYLPDKHRFLRERHEISVAEVQDLFALRTVNNVVGSHWLKAKNIRPITSKRGPIGRPASLYPFAEVERAILKGLPIGFPIRDPIPEPKLRYSQALFVVPVHFFKDRALNCR